MRALQIHPGDNVAVAIVNLSAGDSVTVNHRVCHLTSDVPVKHKFALQAFATGDPVIMYGVLVGKAVRAIQAGERITTENIHHEAAAFHPRQAEYAWTMPDVSRWRDRTFLGYHRSDGQVGTRNYWLVFPLVFCENRNVRILQEAFQKGLGFAPSDVYRRQVADLAALYAQGKLEEVRQYSMNWSDQSQTPGTPTGRSPVFPNIDGIKFLTHEGGCGGTRDDARLLCGLIAGYIHHPNVAGATILSLGCQNAQISLLRDEIARRAPAFDKPLIVVDQQQSQLESIMLSTAIQQTFLALVEANKLERAPASLSHLTVGLKCGGSDGFSGITANPAVGHVSDMMTALGGKSILSEFPELCGVEQNLIDRCVEDRVGERFAHLMRTYAARAEAVGSGFDMNPSPGNIQDGLITDAMKSAGAVKKGGTAPVTDVLDYPEYATKPGLNLLCTPGNDVEAVTGQVGAGANIVLFTTGLGTPTGNPIAPVMKIATNSSLAHRMSDIIDFDCGVIASGQQTIEQTGEAMLETILQIASGKIQTKTEILHQDDFIPWKRGISL